MHKEFRSFQQSTGLETPFVWDAHSGFMPDPGADLENLDRWREAGVNHLSVNVGFDVLSWQNTIQTIAAFRRWINLNSDRYLLATNVRDILQAKEAGKMSITFDIEGANSLDGRIEMVELYHQLGVRQFLLAYNLNNLAAGGCHDEDRGLQPFGRKVVDELNRLGMFVDVSHCGYKTTMDVFEYSNYPVIFSHSNPKALCNHERNITDEQIKACARKDGLIGIAGVSWFMGDDISPDNYSNYVCYVANLVGVEHVAIALDFSFDVKSQHVDRIFEDYQEYWPKASKYSNDSVVSYVKPSRIWDVYRNLLNKGMHEREIKLVFGGNFLRLATRVWT